jgi:hypothetical protein
VIYRALLLLAQVAPVDRDEAREAARRELSKRIYGAHEPGWVQRALSWFFRTITEALAKASAVMPGGGLGLVLLVVALIAVIVLLRLNLGPLRRSDILGERGMSARAKTAEDYRREAVEFAAAGDWREAVRARFRAVIRELESRGVIDQRAGRTAGEIAAEASASMPSVAADMRAAAETFNQIWYGGRAATEAAYLRVVSLDEQVGRTRQTTMAAG